MNLFRSFWGISSIILTLSPLICEANDFTNRQCEIFKAEASRLQPNLPVIKDASSALLDYEVRYLNGVCSIQQRYVINSSLVAAIVARESRQGTNPVTERMVREYFTTAKARDEVRNKLRSKVKHEFSKALSTPNFRLKVSVEAEVVGPMNSFDFILESNQ